MQKIFQNQHNNSYKKTKVTIHQLYHIYIYIYDYYKPTTSQFFQLPDSQPQANTQQHVRNARR
jgi:hypothetical protein